MKIKYIAMIAACALATGCAKGSKSQANDDEKTYIDAWIAANYPNVKPTGCGIYILEETPGTGAAYNGEEYARVSYTQRGLDGKISSTTDEKLSQQTGYYNETYYYGPTVWYVSTSSVSAGVEEMLKGMKAGGTMTALVPSWLITTRRYKSAADYLKHKTNGRHTIYTVSLLENIKDIDEWELDSLKRFSDVHFPGVDTLSKGIYYKQLREPDDTTSFNSDTTVYINYIARMLNGRVFDTNIADTAKKYGLYNASTTYEAKTVSWSDNFRGLKMGESTSSEGSDLISGFSRALWEMRSMEKGVVWFTSAWGYGYTGSGSKIPAYSPLMFEIEMTEKPE